MNESLWQQFHALFAARTGLHIRAQEVETWRATLVQRAQSQHMSPARYFSFLREASADNSDEWARLHALLTNQETYFFRDGGQFELLRRTILPALIERNRAIRSLRVWSAGCSTGEELYSLAIVLDQLLPPRADWETFLVGTDLSDPALKKARQGVYSAWSFRNTPPEIQARYFHQNGRNFVLHQPLRDAVRFQSGNLVGDAFPSRQSGLHDFDLILCRNVFIYFDREAVVSVVQKFGESLRAGGYLLTGHAELHDVPQRDLQTRSFPQSVAYQKCSDATPLNATPLNATPLNIATTRLTRPTAPTQNRLPTRDIEYSICTASRADASRADASRADASRSNDLNATATTASRVGFPFFDVEAARDADDGHVDERDDLEKWPIEEARRLLSDNRPADALRALEILLRAKPSARSFGAHCWAAQILANSGRHEAALTHCRLAGALKPLAPLPLHIEARIAQDCGEMKKARELLQKVVYLAPLGVGALIELHLLYEREGAVSRALAWKEAALRLLQNRDDSALLPLDEWSLDEPSRVGEVRLVLGETRR